MLSVINHDAAIKSVAGKAKQLRLSKDLSRKTLSEISGVPIPTIRRFESSGHISLISLLKVAEALNSEEDFSRLFEMNDIDAPCVSSRRERGRK